MDPESGLDGVLNAGIRGARVAALSREALRGREEIDGAGAVLAPGFIDIHTHEDFFEGEGEKPRFSLPRETAALALRTGNTTILGGNCGFSNYPLGDYGAALEEAALPVNCLTLAGNCALREQLGLGPYDRASPPQIARLGDMAREALDQGARGISFGLQYAPGTGFEELCALARAAAERKAFFAVHLRYDTPGRALDGVREVLEAARISEAALQISHLAANVYGGDNLARAARLIEDSGLPVGADVYPYDAWATTIRSAVFDQGFEEFNFSVEDLEILSGPRAGTYCTAEVFEELRRAPEDTAVACHRAIPPEDIEAAYRLPFVCLGSDALITLDSRGRRKGHPRAAGSPARFLGYYVRERGALSLMEALRKLTLLPAQRLGLPQKGRLREGFDADLVLFEPETIASRADYGIDRCGLSPVGIRAVIRGGKAAYVPGAEGTG
jgi:N-acyl-D-amino-acid deacylase